MENNGYFKGEYYIELVCDEDTETFTINVTKATPKGIKTAWFKDPQWFLKFIDDFDEYVDAHVDDLINQLNEGKVTLQ